MQENYKILVVDDDMRLRALLERYLTEQGFQVRSVANAEQMDRLLTRESFHLMVLDLMLPGEDGLSICRRLRSQSNPMPIIMVTAKGEEVDRVVGFEVGADDYVVKPFSPRELVLRVDAILRRAVRNDMEAEAPEAIEVGSLVIDVPRHSVRVEGQEVALTALEFKLLLDLASRMGRVQSRDALLERVWNYTTGVETRTVDTHVKRLREKLGAGSKYIETVRGVGYRMTRVDG